MDRIPIVIGFLALVSLLPGSGRCQDQVTVTTPFQSINDSFSESMGFGFGFSGPGFFFHNGLGGPGAPFGPVPGGATFGGSGRFGNVNFRWNAFAGQGSSRSMVMAAPSVTMMNGSSGFFAHGQMRPFVTGVVPIVGEHSVSPIDLSLQRLSETGGLEYALERRRQERRRAEEAGRAKDRSAESLPPLPTEDDPPLILNGSGDSNAGHGAGNGKAGRDSNDGLPGA